MYTTLELDIHSKTPATSLVGKNWDIAFSVLCPLAVYIAAVFSFGPGITNDSVNYLSAALTIDQGMLKVDSTPFFEWPPLFPVLLYPANLLNIDILTYTSIFNGLVLAINSSLIFFILKRIVKNKIILFAGLVLLSFSVPMLQIHIMIWSEPLFITLVLLNILTVEKYLQKPNWKKLLLITFISILMFLQRKTGLIFSLSTILFILLIDRKKIIHLSFYTLFSAIPIIWWFKRRELLSGKYFGHGEMIPEKITDNLEQFFNTFSTYFLPMPLPLGWRIFLLLLFFIPIIYLNRKSLKRVIQNFKLFSCLWFTISYYSFIIIGLVYLHISEEIDDRILIPVYPLTMVLFLWLSDLLYSRYSTSSFFKFLVSVIIFGWLTYPAYRTLHHLKRWNTQGTGGYNTINWNNHPLVEPLEKITDLNIIYSNYINPLYYQLNLVRKKNFKILEISKQSHINTGSLLVCFKNPELTEEQIVDCLAGQIINKKIIIENESGTIWEIASN